MFCDVSSLGLLLTRDELVVVSKDDIDLSVASARLIARTQTPLDAMLGLLSRTISHYLEHLKTIKVIARELQQKISLSMENEHLLRMAEIYSTIFSGLMDARGTLVNNNMNLLRKKLAVINVVFLPLNLIASIGGMSEYSAMTHPLDWRVAYGVFGIGMVVIGWLTAVALKRMDIGGEIEMRIRKQLRRRS